MTKLRILFSTVDSVASAETIARKLISERLAACVNILSEVTSIYRWENDLQRDTEVLIIIKTAGDKVASTIERIKELHPYDVPEVISCPIESGFGPYLDWVFTETRLQDSR